MLKRSHYDYVVIGGGLYGSVLAADLALMGSRVLLIEKEGRLIERASLRNQARVHNGYHYPRSLLTALRSRVNFPRFVEDFAPAIVSNFETIYAIPRQFSKVSARQFQRFTEHFGAPIERASRRQTSLFNMNLIDGVFSVMEYAFDAIRLREIMVGRLEQAGVEVALNTCVDRVTKVVDGIRVEYTSSDGPGLLTGTEVVNCTYSGINHLLKNSGLPTIRLKHEWTEMALITPPEELKSIGITVMCGPFFSCMPYPPEGLHSLSHVRYTPHFSWVDSDLPERLNDDVLDQLPQVSRFPHMIRAAARYVPCLSQSIQKGSLWEIKTVLPQSEGDDSRPILFRRNHGLEGLTCIMGGKIDNIYDAVSEFRGGNVCL